MGWSALANDWCKSWFALKWQVGEETWFITAGNAILFSTTVTFIKEATMSKDGNLWYPHHVGHNEYIGWYDCNINTSCSHHTFDVNLHHVLTLYSFVILRVVNTTGLVP